MPANAAVARARKATCGHVTEGGLMSVSRRTLLRQIGVGAVVGAAAPALRGFSHDAAAEAVRGNYAGADQPVRVATAADPVLLYRNENPYGASEKVLAALRESVTSSNRYPRTEYDTLVGKLAAQHNVKREQIVLGCGSGEILGMAALAFLKPGKKLVQAGPTFPSLGKLAQAAGIEVASVPLNKRYEHDLPAMLEAARSSTGLVYIVNPNNPTGTITPRKDIEAFIGQLPSDVTVLIDEAYHHFVAPNTAYESFLDRRFDDPRIIVSRTFSKIYGLAGMRIGYAVATPEMAKRLPAGFPNWSVSVVSARAASAALDDVDYVRLGIKRNTDDRQEFMNQVNARKLYAIDSQTNFVMMNPMRSPDEVIDYLKKNHILIGPKYPVLDKYIRVSLGTPEEMQTFWRAWDLMPAAGKMAI
jgi:histidinol-phosphate aminotransferase